MTESYLNGEGIWLWVTRITLFFVTIGYTFLGVFFGKRMFCKDSKLFGNYCCGL